MFPMDYSQVKSVLQKEHQLDIISEAVANVSHCFNEAMFWVLNLASQSLYVDINRPVTTIIIVIPDLIKQCSPIIDTAFVTGQEFEQLIRLKGQLYYLAGNSHLAAGEVYYQVVTSD